MSWRFLAPPTSLGLSKARTVLGLLAYKPTSKMARTHAARVLLSTILLAGNSQAQRGITVAPPMRGFTVPSAPPQPPAKVEIAAASDSSLAISWTPPLDNGGTELLAYKVTRGEFLTSH